MVIEIIHIGPACWVSPANLYLHDGRLLVGRSPRCQLKIDDKTVSRKHAEIVRQDSRVTLTDLKSTNGTYVNDQRVTSCELLHTARLQFGRIGFLMTVMETQVGRWGSDTPTDVFDEEESGERMIDNLLYAMKMRFSQAETRVFRLLALGESEKEMAKELSLSHHTIHNHIKAIYKTLGIHSRAQLLHCLSAAKLGERFEDGSSSE